MENIKRQKDEIAECIWLVLEGYKLGALSYKDAVEGFKTVGLSFAIMEMQNLENKRYNKQMKYERPDKD